LDTSIGASTTKVLHLAPGGGGGDDKGCLPGTTLTVAVVSSSMATLSLLVSRDDPALASVTLLQPGGQVPGQVAQNAFFYYQVCVCVCMCVCVYLCMYVYS
jgi:hypothetical protein